MVLCAVCLALGSRASGQTTDRGGDFYPLQPAQLLALLPAPPQNWKLISSMARERISYAFQPETLAVRKYLFVPPPPPPSTPPAPPSPPKEVTVTLLDTGRDPERMGSFDNFKPGTDPTTASRLLMQGFETIRVINDPSSFLTLKVSDRFILSGQFDNMKPPEIDVWTQWLQLQKMADASNAAPSVPLVSGTISLTYIDEFKPSTNFTSKASFENKADLKKAQVHH